MTCPFGNGPGCPSCREARLHSWFWLAMIGAAAVLVCIGIGVTS